MNHKCVLSVIGVSMALQACCFNPVDAVLDRQERMMDKMMEHQKEIMREFFSHQKEMMRDFDVDRTCAIASRPEGAEVWEVDIFGKERYLGKTPLVVDRPLQHSTPVFIKKKGFSPVKLHLIPTKVHKACVEVADLKP